MLEKLALKQAYRPTHLISEKINCTKNQHFFSHKLHYFELTIQQKQQQTVVFDILAVICNLIFSFTAIGIKSVFLILYLYNSNPRTKIHSLNIFTSFNRTETVGPVFTQVNQNRRICLFIKVKFFSFGFMTGIC